MSAVECRRAHWRRRAPVALLVLVCCLPLGVLAGQLPFRATTHEIGILVDIRDEAGHPVTGLDPAKLKFLVDRTERRPKSVAEVRLDLAVTVLVDSSMSVRTRLGRAAPLILSPLVDAMSSSDRLALGSFGVEVAIGPLDVPNRPRFLALLDEQLWIGGGTPLWQAIETAATRGADEGRRCVIFVLSDGVDTGAQAGADGTFSGAERALMRSRCLLVVLGAVGDVSRRLEELATATGGRVFAESAATPSPDLLTLPQRLRQAYLVSFDAKVVGTQPSSLEVDAQPFGRASAPRHLFALAPPGASPLDQAEPPVGIERATRRPGMGIVVDLSHSVVNPNPASVGPPSARFGREFADALAMGASENFPDVEHVALSLVGTRPRSVVLPVNPSLSAAIHDQLVAHLGIPAGDSPVLSAAIKVIDAVGPSADGWPLVIMSDGMVTGDGRTFMEFEREVRRSGCRLFVGLSQHPIPRTAAIRFVDATSNPWVMLHPFSQHPVPNRLRALARDSGGRFAPALNPEDIKALLHRAGTEGGR